MVNESKILTVSYGTFSCTLEGFDDPFSTMRSIAEYFRDLAAGDRYFGAEPPTPDAEMLHRIAEREIDRKVEARIEDNSVVLRQADSVTPTGTPQIIPAEILLADADENEAEVEVEEAAPEAEPEIEDAVEDTIEPSAPIMENVKMAVADVADVAEGEVEADVDVELEIEPEVEAVAETLVETVIEEPSAPIDPSDTSIAAKLRRIRAVVDNRGADTSREDRENGLGDDFFDDANEGDDIAADTASPLADILAQDPVEPAADEYTEDEVVEAEVSEDDADDILSGISDAIAADDDSDDDSDEDDFEDEDGFSDDLDDEDDAEDDGFDDENVFAEDETPEPVAIARVVKVRRAEVASEEDTAEPEIMSEGNSMLSPEDEADLIAELAEVERDGSDEDYADVKFEAEPTAEVTDAVSRTAFDDGDFAGTDAMDRIMAETNTKLESDEASNKRTSIAHLRAAVQAKRDDVEAGTDDNGDDEDGDYREDLARVVRPRRLSNSDRQVSRRLAPLVLVSEQRVDETVDADAPAEAVAPVRPRRIVQAADEATDQSDDADQNGDFAAFAAELDATSPGDLLEAAAAWRIFVKQQDFFSRPQVMSALAISDDGGELTREDGLRAFGQLIREGVIEKVARGRYTISQQSRYRPDQTRASA